MRGLGSQGLMWTFYLVLAFLILTRWKGANALLGTGVGGYARIVRSLQGR